MAMDFFEQQYLARKKTGRLVLMFIAAVVGIIIVKYLAVAGILTVAMAQQPSDPTQYHGPPPNFFTDWRLAALIAVCVTTVVALASLYKSAALKGGGRVVAETLGGRLIDPGSRDPDERKLLNVVEEMAIASGTPVPPVYIMEDEQAINAFAAGYAPQDAVVAVTRGCVQNLSRDELQGVIGHEFSHILNGDMRLNIRLIGILFGILALALIGQGVLRSLRYTRIDTGRSRNGKGGGGGVILAIIAIALVLMVIGYLGVFFGNLIKAAVSRQREFLADASSVQFTRNPAGITGALKKIGGFSFGSAVTHPHAAECSHMYFGSGVSSIFATHPPLGERIRRIDPNWDGQYTVIRTSDVDRQLKQASPLRTRARGLAYAMALGAAAGERTEPTPGTAPSRESLQEATRVLESIPQSLREAARMPMSAQAMVLSLLLQKADGPVLAKQVAALNHAYDGAFVSLVQSLAQQAGPLSSDALLSLVSLASPTLGQMSGNQHRVFKATLDQLVHADERVSLFEWALVRIIKAQVDARLTPPVQRAPRFYSLRPVSDACVALLSVIAHAGSSDTQTAQRAYAQGLATLGFPATSILDRTNCSLAVFDQALDTLEAVGPREKRTLVVACATTIHFDRNVTDEEAQLFRAVTGSLGVPVPL
ncbi:MAG: M48 family metalloprotease [Phycisphaera sp.]|nr:M48 family metalloprotease [Phycisphaera sp.]